jgi:hypothetical protein
MSTPLAPHRLSDAELIRYTGLDSPATPLELALVTRLGLALDYIAEAEAKLAEAGLLDPGFEYVH